MLVPSTVLQRIVGDCDTISREVEKEGGRKREGKKEREKDGERQTERFTIREQCHFITTDVERGEVFHMIERWGQGNNIIPRDVQ